MNHKFSQEVLYMKSWLKAVLITAGAVAATAAAVAVLTAPGAADAEKKSTLYGRNVAHRGLHDRSGQRPENSLSAFRAAADAGYGAEMDARLTADDVPVILHDENTLRMCGEDKEVAETSLAELRELRLGESDEQIPTLDEALDAVEVHLNSVAVEGGEMFLGDDILMEHHIYLLPIHPLGHLTLLRNNKVYLAHKGHILCYAAKQIFQSAPITKTLLQHRLVGVFRVVALPHRVQAIYVCNNYIHFRNIFNCRRQSTTTKVVF